MRERSREYGLAADLGPAAVTCFLRDYDLWWDMNQEEQDMVIRLWIACQDAKDVKEETGDWSLVQLEDMNMDLESSLAVLFLIVCLLCFSHTTHAFPFVAYSRH